MSREFGWTPGQIAELTIQQFDHYMAHSYRHRLDVPPSEISLELLRKAFFGFAGIEEPAKTPLDEQLGRAGAVNVAGSALDAWKAAGMPTPARDWLDNYRKQVQHGTE